MMLKLIDLITLVRVGAQAEEGLDAAMHGKSAYELGGAPLRRPTLNGLQAQASPAMLTPGHLPLA
jgi:hypothetical protein